MSQCESCHSGCCRAFAVPVTGADILRIRSRLSMEFHEFVCRWADPEGEIALNHAPHFHFSDEPATPFVICLMHHESHVFPGTTRCEFLDETAPTAQAPLGTARCSIYPERPSTCRAFPAKLNATGELAILYDVPSHARDASQPVYALCPRPWQPEDLDPVQQVQDLVVAKYEMQFFHCLASIWNEQPGRWSDFPQFLEYVYVNRLRPSEEADEVDRELPVQEAVFPRIAA
jgi:Fe-S-cluster containining protein